MKLPIKQIRKLIRTLLKETDDFARFTAVQNQRFSKGIAADADLGLGIKTIDISADNKTRFEIVHNMKKASTGWGDAFEEFCEQNVFFKEELLKIVSEKSQDKVGPNIINTNSFSSNSPYADIAVGTYGNKNTWPIEADYEVERLSYNKYIIRLKSPLLSAKATLQYAKAQKGITKPRLATPALSASTIKPHTLYLLALEVVTKILNSNDAKIKDIKEYKDHYDRFPKIYLNCGFGYIGSVLESSKNNPGIDINNDTDPAEILKNVNIFLKLNLLLTNQGSSMLDLGDVNEIIDVTDAAKREVHAKNLVTNQANNVNINISNFKKLLEKSLVSFLELSNIGLSRLRIDIAKILFSNTFSNTMKERQKQIREFYNDILDYLSKEFELPSTIFQGVASSLFKINIIAKDTIGNKIKRVNFSNKARLSAQNNRFTKHGEEIILNIATKSPVDYPALVLKTGQLNSRYSDFAIEIETMDPDGTKELGSVGALTKFFISSVLFKAQFERERIKASSPSSPQDLEDRYAGMRGRHSAKGRPRLKEAMDYLMPQDYSAGETQRQLHPQPKLFQKDIRDMYIDKLSSSSFALYLGKLIDFVGVRDTKNNLDIVALINNAYGEKAALPYIDNIIDYVNNEQASMAGKEKTFVAISQLIEKLGSDLEVIIKNKAKEIRDANPTGSDEDIAKSLLAWGERVSQQRKLLFSNQIISTIQENVNSVIKLEPSQMIDNYFDLLILGDYQSAKVYLKLIADAANDSDPEDVNKIKASFNAYIEAARKTPILQDENNLIQLPTGGEKITMQNLNTNSSQLKLVAESKLYKTILSKLSKRFKS